MKLKWWTIGFGMAMACSQSFAWMAFASGDNSNTSIFFNAESSEAATKGAMKLCEKEHTNCKVDKAVNGTVMVVAKGDGGWGMASNPSPEKAEETALASCRKSARNCIVKQAVWDSGVVWGAIAVGGGSHFLVVNARTKEQAETDALAGCKKRTDQPQACAITPGTSSSARLYYARAISINRVDFSGKQTAEEAKQSALENCNKNTEAGSQCKLDDVLLNESDEPEPKGMARLRALAERNSAVSSAPQATPRVTVAATKSINVLRCSNQCTNGMCVRTFENGRKERWNAPRVFNPSTQNWEWDTNTNACGG